jgi:hypothetical protein
MSLWASIRIPRLARFEAFASSPEYRVTYP